MILSQFEEAGWHRRGSDCDIAEAWHGSGYMLIASVDPQTFDVSRGQVVGGRLHWPAHQNGGQEVTQFDHALLALERFETVAEEGTGLAEALFGQAWAAVRRAAKREAAEEALEKLRDTIAASPDLTEDDRLKLLTAYAAAAGKLAEARWPGPKPMTTARGSATESLRSRLSGSAAQLDKQPNGAQAAVAGRLRAAVAQLAKPLDLPDPQETNAVKNREADIKAILGFAQSIKIADTIAPADAILAARAVAGAIRL
jgi:hypothetical protein